MNYIYDILLNFKEELYDFYDWNQYDNIIHIRKIPLFKITTNNLDYIKKNIIEFENSFLDKIKNKTEVFTTKSIRSIEYACLFSDGYDVLAVQIKDKKLKKSKLLIDEEMEALDTTGRLKKLDFNYRIIKSININHFKTRKEAEIEKYIKKEIKKIIKEEEKLKYIYYECFNKKEENSEKIILNINKEIKKDSNKINKKLYNFFKLTQVHK